MLSWDRKAVEQVLRPVAAFSIQSSLLLMSEDADRHKLYMVS